MTAGEAFHEARRRLLATKPALVREFESAVEVLAGIGSLTPEYIAAACELALASEYLYAPPARFIPLSLSRSEFPLFARLLHGSVEGGYEYGTEFLRLYPTLAFPLAPIAEAYVDLIPALKAVGGDASAVSFCLGPGDPALVVLHLRCFTSLARAAGSRMGEVMRSASECMKRLPPARYRDWVRLGTAYLESGRTDAGIDFLTLHSREVRAFLSMTDAVLTDVAGYLRIYASGLAGRQVSIGTGNEQVWGIRSPYTDGRTVYLPAAVGYFDRADLNERAYTALASLQATAVRETFGFSLKRITFLDELRQRYGTVLPDVLETLRAQFRGRAKTVRERSTGELEAVFEGDRVLRLLSTFHEEFFFLFPTPLIVRFLFSLVETARIEGRLSAKYPGLSEDFRLLNAALRKRRERKRAHGQGDAVFGRLDAVIESLVVMSLGGESDSLKPDPEDRESLSVERLAGRLREEFSRAGRDGATVHDSAETVFRMYNLLYDSFPLVPYSRQREFAPLLSGVGKGEFHPEIAFDVSPELFAGHEGRPAFDDLQVPEEGGIDLTSFGSREKKSDRIRRALVMGSLRIYRYPEYDVSRAGYREKHCTLYETLLPEGPPGWADGIRKRYDRVHRRLRKRFLMLQPEEMELSRKWYDGDELHIGDAMDRTTDLSIGRSPDEKIFQRKIVNRRDITAAVLLDASSSTDSVIAGERIIDIEKAALVLLGSALESTGDRFGMFTFFSMGRHNVFFNIVKDFDEPWSAKVGMRAASIESNASNRDGCAVRHAAARLLSRPGKTKLLFILSDGIPADSGYGAASGAETNAYAIEDTRRALLECRMRGIIPFCITIDVRAKEYIPRLYGAYRYAVLHDVTKLPEKLSNIYARITR